MVAEIVAELVDALPAGIVVTSPESLEAYRWDRAEDPMAALPIAVVRAETTEQVQLAVGIAARAGVPVVPRGAGTGLSAGASSAQPALVISLERMRGIEVDAPTRVAVVQPGALNKAAERPILRKEPVIDTVQVSTERGDLYRVVERCSFSIQQVHCGIA